MISEEKFWNQDLKNIINKLKLKGTYGLVGNDNIGKWEDRFFYMSEVNLNGSGANFNWGQDFERNVGTINMIRYRNEKIKGNCSKMNLGIEVGLLISLTYSSITSLNTGKTSLANAKLSRMKWDSVHLFLLIKEKLLHMDSKYK